MTATLSIEAEDRNISSDGKRNIFRRPSIGYLGSKEIATKAAMFSSTKTSATTRLKTQNHEGLKKRFLVDNKATNPRFAMMPKTKMIVVMRSTILPWCVDSPDFDEEVLAESPINSSMLYDKGTLILHVTLNRLLITSVGCSPLQKSSRIICRVIVKFSYWMGSIMVKLLRRLV